MIYPRLYCDNPNCDNLYWLVRNSFYWPEDVPITIHNYEVLVNYLLFYEMIISRQTEVAILFIGVKTSGFLVAVTPFPHIAKPFIFFERKLTHEQILEKIIFLEPQGTDEEQTKLLLL